MIRVSVGVVALLALAHHGPGWVVVVAVVVVVVARRRFSAVAPTPGLRVLHRKTLYGKNPLRKQNQARLALPHEAGHAVAMNALGVRVTKMAVDGKGGGYTACSRDLGRRASMLIVLAGPLAEARQGNATLTDALSLGAGCEGSDHDVATELGAFAALRRWEKRTAKLMEGREGEVAALAEALGKRGKLNSGQVKKAIREGRNRPSGGRKSPGATQKHSPWRTLPKAASAETTKAARVSPWRRFT